MRIGGLRGKLGHSLMLVPLINYLRSMTRVECLFFIVSNLSATNEIKTEHDNLWEYPLFIILLMVRAAFGGGGGVKYRWCVFAKENPI